MTGMTPERLQAIEDRLPGEVFPNSVERDVLDLLDEVRRLRAENGNLRAGAKSFVRQLDRLANGIEALADWHETKAEKAERFRPEIDGENRVMDKAAQVHRDADLRLRALLNPTEGETDG